MPTFNIYLPKNLYLQVNNSKESPSQIISKALKYYYKNKGGKTNAKDDDILKKRFVSESKK